MPDLPDEAVPWVSAADDAILDPVLCKKSEAGSERSAPTLAARLLNYGPHVALTAWLFGAAWLVGSYLVGPAPTVVKQERVQSAEMGPRAQKMAEEPHAQNANVEAMRAAQSLNTKDVAGPGTTKPRLEAAKTENSPAGKLEHLRPKSAEKPLNVSERVDRIGLKIAALLASGPVAAHSVWPAPVPPKRAKVARGDAFDPSQHPDAPGAPRPLGALAGAAIGNNSVAE